MRNKITFADKQNMNPIVDERKQITAENMNEIKRVVNNLPEDAFDSDLYKNIKRHLDDLKNLALSGLCDDETQTLTAGTWHRYDLEDSVKLYGIEFLGSATIQVGSQRNLADLGDYTGTQGSFLSLGFISKPYVYLHSNRNVEIIPIVYKRNKLL